MRKSKICIAMGIPGAALLSEMNFGTKVKMILECLFDQQ